jgi:hypothetical protein
MQHREALGMGGSVASKNLGPAEFVVACGLCNASFEADRQQIALAKGWKLRRFRDHDRWPAFRVPYFDETNQRWWVPDEAGNRIAVDAGLAQIAIQFANGV